MYATLSSVVEDVDLGVSCLLVVEEEEDEDVSSFFFGVDLVVSLFFSAASLSRYSFAFASCSAFDSLPDEADADDADDDDTSDFFGGMIAVMW